MGMQILDPEYLYRDAQHNERADMLKRKEEQESKRIEPKQVEEIYLALWKYPLLENEIDWLLQALTQHWEGKRKARY